MQVSGLLGGVAVFANLLGSLAVPFGMLARGTASQECLQAVTFLQLSLGVLLPTVLYLRQHASSAVAFFQVWGGLEGGPLHPPYQGKGQVKSRAEGWAVLICMQHDGTEATGAHAFA